MNLPLIKLFNKLQNKAMWKGLNPKARKITASLLIYSIYSMIAALIFTGVFTISQAENVRLFGFLSIYAWIILTFLALTSNATGAVLTQLENYTPQNVNYIVLKNNKSILLMQKPVLSVASYRAGNARAHRSPSRSNASSGNTGDGESDSGGDPPQPAYSFLLRPSLYLFSSISKLNSFFLFPWRFLYVPGYLCMAFHLQFTDRRWSL